MTIKLQNLFNTKHYLKLCLSFFVVISVVSLAVATDFRQLAKLAEQRYGNQAKQTVLNLESLLIELESASDTEKLKRINHFFNLHINFVSDQENWGEKDYWATPLESLGTTKGDCEDYSIAKYVFLRELGIPDEQLKLTYVRATIGGSHSKVVQAHMVLSYYAAPNAQPVILDNLIDQIHDSSRRVDLQPIFSFNSQGLWTGITNKSRGSSLKSLSRWSNVLARIKNDGIQ